MGLLSRFMNISENKNTQLMQQLIRLLLAPLVRLLIKHSVSHSEFAEIAKQSYVEQAYRHFGIPKRKMTFARVAVLTGLSRKEVVRLREQELSDEKHGKQPKISINRAARVITGWLQDSDFLTAEQQPKPLALKSQDSEVDFAALVERYSGDISPGAILDELLLSKQVEKNASGQVELKQAGYTSDSNSIEQMQILAQCAHNLLATGSYNINRDDSQAPRFQRQLSYSVSAELADQFQQYSQGKSLELLLDFNRWLGEHSNNSQPDQAAQRVGVGIYYFQNSNPADKK